MIFFERFSWSAVHDFVTEFNSELRQPNPIYTIFFQIEAKINAICLFPIAFNSFVLYLPHLKNFLIMILILIKL
jgi:hypothetical protein